MVEIGAACWIFYFGLGRIDSSPWSSWSPGRVESSGSASTGMGCCKIESRWEARAEPAAAVVWGVWGKSYNGGVPSSSWVARGKRGYTRPYTRGAWELVALGWPLACLGVLITKPDRNRTQTSLFFISKCWQYMYFVFPASLCTQGGQEWAFHFFSSHNEDPTPVYLLRD